MTPTLPAYLAQVRTRAHSTTRVRSDQDHAFVVGASAADVPALIKIVEAALRAKEGWESVAGGGSVHDLDEREAALAAAIKEATDGH